MANEIIGRGWAFPLKIDTQGGISLTSDRNEIEQSIKIILQTEIGQRVMRPRFGSRLHELVFAPNNEQTAALARRYVEEALRMWEPRINKLDINVTPDPQEAWCLLIEINFTVKSINDRRSLVYPFYLIQEEA
jgi:phage baseplate assembly protein W